MWSKRSYNKFILVLAATVTLAASCGREGDTDTSNDISGLSAIKSRYVQLIGNDPQELVDRCDRLTFVGLYEAFGKRTTKFMDYEYGAKGKWNRDVEPCWPDDSRSEISLEGILGATHGLVTRKDKSALKRLRNYAIANGYVMGDGPTQYTFMPQLAFVLEKAYKLADSERTAFDKLDGYRGNVIADYILLHGRIYGYIGRHHLLMLEELIKVAPNNPIYHAIYHRFLDGDQRRAIELLADFNADILPQGADSRFHWGSASSAILFIYTVGIMEGI